MTLFCSHCLNKFKSEREREFCGPVCYKAYHKAERDHVRKVRAELRASYRSNAGTFSVIGGRQAINFGLSDGAAPWPR